MAFNLNTNELLRSIKTMLNSKKPRNKSSPKECILEHRNHQRMNITVGWPMRNHEFARRFTESVRITSGNVRVGHEQTQQRRQVVDGLVQSVLQMQRRPHLLVVLDDCQQSESTRHQPMIPLDVHMEHREWNLLAMSVFVVGDRLFTPGLITATCAPLGAAAAPDSSGFFPNRISERPSLQETLQHMFKSQCRRFYQRHDVTRTCRQPPSDQWSHSSRARTVGGWRHRCRWPWRWDCTMLPAWPELRECSWKLAATQWWIWH